MYLGTGSGKTYIAVKLIQSYREQLRQGKKAIFLVSSVPLVDQQKREIENTTAMNVGSYCGADGVDDWGQEEWDKQLEKNDVLVMVHQVFQDMLQHSFFTLQQVFFLAFQT